MASAPFAKLGLAELERAAATAPRSAAIWSALLTAIIDDRISDDRIGESLTASDRSFRVAVVTAYHREPVTWLERCHASVRAQTYSCSHILVADGFPRDELDTWDIEHHLKLSSAHGDFGDTPRSIGGQFAASAGFHAVLYLDSDNMMRPRHVESLVARHQQSGAAVCYSGRTYALADGTFVPYLGDDDVRGHIDTNCLLVASPAFAFLDGWTIYPRELAGIGDRLFVERLRSRGFAPACTGALTMHYTINRANVYRAMGRPVPPGTPESLNVSPIVTWLDSASDTDLDSISDALGFRIDKFLREFLGRS